MSRPARVTALALALVTWSGQAAAQADTGGSGPRPKPAFRFSAEAGHSLRALWEQSVAAEEERVACLGASIRNDTVFVECAQALGRRVVDERPNADVRARATHEFRLVVGRSPREAELSRLTRLHEELLSRLP